MMDPEYNGPYSDKATGLATEWSWLDSREGQDIFSSPKHSHWHWAHSASIQYVN